MITLEDFEIGDVVSLASGGPEMTINGFVQDDGDTDVYAECVWFPYEWQMLPNNPFNPFNAATQTEPEGFKAYKSSPEVAIFSLESLVYVTQ